MGDHTSLSLSFLTGKIGVGEVPPWGLSRGSYEAVPAQSVQSMMDSFGHINILWSSSGPLISAGTVSLSLSDRYHAEGGAPGAMKQSSATSFLIQGPHPPPCPAWWVRGVLPICACQAKAAMPRTRVLNGGNAALQVAGFVITNGGHEHP